MRVSRKKYDGKSIKIAGLNFGDFQLGKFDIEPKLLHIVSHALKVNSPKTVDVSVSVLLKKSKRTSCIVAEGYIVSKCSKVPIACYIVSKCSKVPIA
jgi:hypothetical protein